MGLVWCIPLSWQNLGLASLYIPNWIRRGNVLEISSKTRERLMSNIVLCLTVLVHLLFLPSGNVWISNFRCLGPSDAFRWSKYKSLPGLVYRFLLSYIWGCLVLAYCTMSWHFSHFSFLCRILVRTPTGMIPIAVRSTSFCWLFLSMNGDWLNVLFELRPVPWQLQITLLCW